MGVQEKHGYNAIPERTMEKIERTEILGGVPLPGDFVRKMGYLLADCDMQIENLQTGTVDDLPKKVPIIIGGIPYSKESSEFPSFYLIPIEDEGDAAFISRVNESLLIHALKTREGIYLDGTQVNHNPMLVFDGSEIKVGKYKFRISNKY